MAQADHLGLSLELTAVTLALIESCLWLRPLASWLLLGTLSAAFVVEAALVTMQAWRVIISLAILSSAGILKSPHGIALHAPDTPCRLHCSRTRMAPHRKASRNERRTSG